MTKNIYKSLAFATLASLTLAQSSGLVLAQESPQTSETTTSLVTSQTSNQATVQTAISLTASQRSGANILDQVMSLGQAASAATPVTLTLKNASGQVINSLTYTINRGQRGFTAWFDVNNLPAGTYTISLTGSGLSATTTTSYKPVTKSSNQAPTANQTSQAQVSQSSQSQAATAVTQPAVTIGQQSVSTVAVSQASAVTSQAATVSNPAPTAAVSTKSSKSILPSTGEATSLLAAAGGLFLGLALFLGLKKKG